MVLEECSEAIMYQIIATRALHSTETFWLRLGIEPSYQVWWLLQGLLSSSHSWLLWSAVLCVLIS